MDPITIGVGGPVGAGKTALIEKMVEQLRDEYSMAVVTNDIYTKEDQKILLNKNVLPQDRIIGVETGGCPHTAIREDTSMNDTALNDLKEKHPDTDLFFVESGGDNLAATFSPELVDFSIYIIDVAQGEKIPRKGGQGMIKSDLFIINKTDLAPFVEADLDVMEADAQTFRGNKAFVFTNLKDNTGVDQVVDWIKQHALLVGLN
ncbi:urease accessory protein UreG [Barrientosiimonas marina]|uniref:Urease accessory protein UreG n=1 Tax=Lentibacillus kimchii TaxID=1542911 RepID=A0ABW2URS5_9BACI